MRGGANISEALRRVWARPWLLVALALTNIGLSYLLTAPLSAMLASLLDKRPAAAQMAAGDDGLWFEFLRNHIEVSVAATMALGAGVVVYSVLSWILDGGVLAALALDGERRARGGAAVLAESASRARRMIVIGLFGLVLRVLPALFGGLGYAVARVAIKGRTFQPNVEISMIALVFAALAWTAVSIAIDYARGLSLDDRQTRSWRLVARGVRLVFARGSATLQLIAFTLAAWLALALVYWLIASHLSAMPLVSLVRLLAVFARVAITLTTLTAAARIAKS
ncbi:MAG TPA: hypothetical protein VGL86_13070 [Polyangia bacterium]|jgi:hypothetical protein